MDSQTGNDVPDLEAGPLDGVTMEGGAYVFGNEEAETSKDSETKKRFRATIIRIVPAGAVHGFMRGVYRSIGNKYELSSLTISEDDKNFKEACDYLYRDLESSVFGPIINHFSDEALDKFVVYLFGFGAPIWLAMDEAKERKKLAEETPDPEPANESEEGQGNE